jgi:VIT1/CCC1 family predicted Fe2+/Mn2+ transporter
VNLESCTNHILSKHPVITSGSTSGDSYAEDALPESITDHVAEARQRARNMLAGESHLGAVDDWRRALVSARDALIFIWLAWAALHGFGDPPLAPYLLISLGLGLALLLGISTARSTHTQVQFYATEFERERHEIREDFEQEREEVRALYAAKGFREPLLTQVVDVLCADEDRLLKVMMEEELGLSMYHVNHPLLVGLWNFAGAGASGMMLALPTIWLSEEAVHFWVPGAGAVGLGVIAALSAWATKRSFMEFLAVGLVMAIVTGGTVFFLAQWLASCMTGEG